MRIVLIYDFLYELGGLERLMVNHARFLKEKGYDVVLVFGDIDDKIKEDKMFKEFKIINYGKV